MNPTDPSDPVRAAEDNAYLVTSSTVYEPYLVTSSSNLVYDDVNGYTKVIEENRFYYDLNRYVEIEEADPVPAAEDNGNPGTSASTDLVYDDLNGYIEIEDDPATAAELQKRFQVYQTRLRHLRILKWRVLAAFDRNADKMDEVVDVVNNQTDKSVWSRLAPGTMPALDRALWERVFYVFKGAYTKMGFFLPDGRAVPEGEEDLLDRPSGADWSLGLPKLTVKDIWGDGEERMIEEMWAYVNGADGR